MKSTAFRKLPVVPSTTGKFSTEEKSTALASPQSVKKLVDTWRTKYGKEAPWKR